MIKEVPMRWKKQYGSSPKDRGESAILRELENLDLTSPIAEKLITEIIGNDTWTQLKPCSSCGNNSDKILQILDNSEDSYENNTIYLCENCLQICMIAMQGSVNLTFERRLETANQIMNGLDDGIKIWFSNEPDNRYEQRIYFNFRYPDNRTGKKLAILDSNQQNLGLRYMRYGFGGTQAYHIGQLIRFIQDRSRHSLDVMPYWTPGERKILEAAGWNNPVKIACVLCGKITQSKDWYSLNGISGPCCSMAVCSREGVKNVNKA